MLLKSLVTIGAILGLVLGIIGMAVPWFLPNIFTPDPKVIQEVSHVSRTCNLSFLFPPVTALNISSFFAK